MGLSDMIRDLQAQVQHQAETEAAAAALPKVIEDAKKYKDDIQGQYDSALSEFRTVANDYQNSKKAFEVESANNQQNKSGQTVQTVTVTKTNPIPLVLAAGVLGYLYWKGKIKI